MGQGIPLPKRRRGKQKEKADPFSFPLHGGRGRERDIPPSLSLTSFPPFFPFLFPPARGEINGRLARKSPGGGKRKVKEERGKSNNFRHLGQILHFFSFSFCGTERERERERDDVDKCRGGAEGTYGRDTSLVCLCNCW